MNLYKYLKICRPNDTHTYNKHYYQYLESHIQFLVIYLLTLLEHSVLGSATEIAYYHEGLLKLCRTNRRSILRS